MWRSLVRARLWSLGILLPLAVVCLFPAPTCDRPVSPFRAMYRQVEVGMSVQEVIALLGPPTEQAHPGLSLGHHFYYWTVSDGTLEVSCDLAGIVYDYGRKAPQEARGDDSLRRMGEYALQPCLLNPALVPDLRDE
jgi:hypothetical protein